MSDAEIVSGLGIALGGNWIIAQPWFLMLRATDRIGLRGVIDDRHRDRQRFGDRVGRELDHRAALVPDADSY